jgi:hypothetical protein
MSMKSGVGLSDEIDREVGFIPRDFVVPLLYVHPLFRIMPIGPEHNERDYRAWNSSIDHIRRSPGFEKYDWPREMTAEQNLSDIVRHAEEFRQRSGFMYTVMTGCDVIGCVHICPADAAGRAKVFSWVRADKASLDGVLYRVVQKWLRDAWPFEGIVYASRKRQV